jgi:hypothetical protein
VQTSSQQAGSDGDPGVALPLHLEQHHRAQHQRHTGQHLVGNAEQRPQGVDAAQRIDHALVQEVAPGGDAQAGGDQVGGQESVCRKDGTKVPSRSCSMKRPRACRHRRR